MAGTPPDARAEPDDQTLRPGTRRGLSPTVIVLGWASFCNDVASEMVYPLLPTFLATYLHASRTSLGLVEGLADTLASLLKLWSGAISDRWQRRKSLVVFGYALAAIVRPSLGLATATWQVVAARAADRLGKGIRGAPRDALVVDTTPPEYRGRAFGYQRAMDHLGAALGPLLAFAFLSAWPDALRPLFWLTLLPGLTVVALVGWGLRESPPVAAQPGAARSLTLTLKPFARDFRVYLLANAVFAVGNSTDAFLLLRAAEVGVPTAQLPLLWCLFHVVKSAGSHVAGSAVDRAGARPLLLGGWIIYGLLYAAFGRASAPFAIWAMMPLYALFHAFTEPAERAYVAQLVPEQHRGLAYGWFHFTAGVGALPASLLFGAIYDLAGAPVAFAWSASIAALAALMLGFGVRSPRAGTPSP